MGSILAIIHFLIHSIQVVLQ